MNAHAVSDVLDELLAQAAEAYREIRGDDITSLLRALDAGDALTAARERVAKGQWGSRLQEAGIPASTARLYMRLAQHRQRILAAGCKSIREARELLTERSSPPRRRHTVREHERGGGEEEYARGYADGQRDGYRRGLADGQATRQARDAGRVDLDRRDLRWLVSLAHPDRHEGDLRSTRTTQWLNSLMETKR